MKLIQCILTQNACYKTKAKHKGKGVMLHSTGADNPWARRYAQPSQDDPNYSELMKVLGDNLYNNDWNNTKREVCVHAFIGKLADGSVGTVQTLPWDHRAWHAGTGSSGKSANDTHIAFEICEDGLEDPVYFAEVYREAVELTAMLCSENGFDPLEPGVVICHSEGYKLGIASNHGDVEHWFPKYGKSMDDFRADVAAAMKATKKEDNPVEELTVRVYKTLADVPEWYRPTIDKLMAAGALKGVDDQGTINVDETYCRVMTTLDRMEKLD